MIAMTATAQCSFRNTAFKSGEFLSYNLYYNWKFVRVKAGTASMSTVVSTYKGHKAYRSSLTTRGNKKVDNMFVLRDTLCAIHPQPWSHCISAKAQEKASDILLTNCSIHIRTAK